MTNNNFWTEISVVLSSSRRTLYFNFVIILQVTHHLPSYVDWEGQSWSTAVGIVWSWIRYRRLSVGGKHGAFYTGRRRTPNTNQHWTTCIEYVHFIISSYCISHQKWQHFRKGIEVFAALFSDRVCELIQIVKFTALFLSKFIDGKNKNYDGNFVSNICSCMGNKFLILNFLHCLELHIQKHISFTFQYLVLCSLIWSCLLPAFVCKRCGNFHFSLSQCKII